MIWFYLFVFVSLGLPCGTSRILTLQNMYNDIAHILGLLIDPICSCSNASLRGLCSFVYNFFHVTFERLFELLAMVTVLKWRCLRCVFCILCFPLECLLCSRQLKAAVASSFRD